MDPQQRAAYLRWLRPDQLSGSNLRYSLLTLLAEAGEPRTIAELRRELERRGLRVAGRDPAKTIADVLRYERALGRVLRVGRGRYLTVQRPDTTERRHRDRLRDLVDEGRRRRGPEAWPDEG
jgi:hypothetical protein